MHGERAPEKTALELPADTLECEQLRSLVRATVRRTEPYNVITINQMDTILGRLQLEHQIASEPY